MRHPIAALRPLVAALVLCASLAAGCAGGSPHITTPNGFVAIDEDRLYGDTIYQAVSADGAMITVRQQENETFGTVEFWAEALGRELVAGRGYELLDDEPVQAGGAAGRWLHLRGLLGEQLFRYDVAIFVVGDDIYTVETAAPEADGLYEQHLAAFAGAVQSFTAR